MAYSKKEGLSYIDGIPVKISERFRPPRKTVLPLSFRPRFSLDVLNTEYDFVLEENVLKQAEQRRQEQEALEKAEVEKVGCEIEKFTKSVDDSVAAGQVNIVDSKALQSQSDVAEVPKAGICNPVVANLEVNKILQPQPLMQQPVRYGAPAGNEKKILNLADFENETCNPFDYMELKTINDLEALNTVFQGMSTTDIPTVNSSNPTWNYTGVAEASECSSGTASSTSVTQSPSSSAYYPYLNLSTVQGSSLSNTHLSATSGGSINIPATGTTDVLHSKQFNPVPETSVSHSISSPNSCFTQVNGADSTPIQCTSASVPTSVSSLPPSCFSYSAMSSDFCGASPAYVGRVSTYQNSFPIAALDNPYLGNAGMALAISTKPWAFSGSVDQQWHPSSVISGQPVKLRSSKSASDLRDLPYEFSNATTTTTTVTPRRAWRSSTPPPHHTVLETVSSRGSMNSQPTTSLLPTKSRSQSTENDASRSLRHDTLTNSVALPTPLDPYSTLDMTDQNLVDGIADMGFPTDRVSRAVKHLGNDDKKVIDFLCQLQLLEETGYNLHDAEAALSIHETAEEARAFLDIMVKFQDLGFEKEAIKNALILHNNDRDKALDTLLM